MDKASSLEVQEFLFAATAAQVAMNCEEVIHNVTDYEPVVAHVRAVLRFQRFNVMNWLMMNGVKIPDELLSDQTHPEPGSQYVDQMPR